MPKPTQDRPADDAEDSSGLDELVFECLERMELKGPRGLAEVCAEHPEHAAALSARLHKLKITGLVETDSDLDTIPEQLGEFRLEKRLGRGGMGVVYVARQTSLGREVALKLIRPEQLYFPGARERFRREVEAVARLAHPGIVPVYTVGETQGIPYFAMELVAGASLEEVLTAFRGRTPAQLSGRDLFDLVSRLARERGSSEAGNPAERVFASGWTQACLWIARELAQALEHAHQRGVLHRDIKPSNVMLTPGGRTLLLDFGLASAEGAGRLTRTGSQMGSLPYMAPEQLDGRSAELGPTTDVYGLAVTLYELLTLRRAFDGANEAALRKALLEARLAPIRALNPTVTVDVETVVAKAMESAAARRYASAAELARDLGNLLELRPITARPPSAFHRVVRWTQRRPAAAVASVLGLLLLVAGPLGWELNRMHSARELRDAYAQERIAREQSERHFAAALSAIGHVLRDTATEELEDVPRMQRARLIAIDRALELFAALERDRPDDLLVLSEGGQLHKSRGEVLRDLGRPEEALAAFQRAIDFQRRVIAQEASPERSTHLSAALQLAAKAHSAVGNAREALPLVDEGIELMRAAAAAAPKRLEWRRSVAGSLICKGEALCLLDRHEEADPVLREALAIVEDLHARDPNHQDYVWAIGRTCEWLASVASERSEPEREQQWAVRALEAFQSAQALAPGKRYYAFDVAEGHLTLANTHIDARSLGEAEEHLRAALAIDDQLLRDFPESLRYRNHKSTALGQLGLIFGLRQRHEEAREIFRQIVDERERVCQIAPERCDLASHSAEALLNLAASYQGAHENLDGVLALLDRAEARLAACAGRESKRAEVTYMRGLAQYSRALVLCNLDRLAEALPQIELYQSAAGSDPIRLRYSADLWNEYWLALRRAAPDETAQAAAKQRMLDLLARAIDAGYRDLDELGSTPALEPFRNEPELLALIARAGAAK